MFGSLRGKDLSTEIAHEKHVRDRLAVTVWTLVAGLFVIATLDYAFEAARHFTGAAMDGPFQFYDALRRIHGGFRPGVDFQFFHGLGIPYSHYWLYRLFGGGLQGAELARQLVAAIAGMAVFALVFHLYFRDWVLTACLAAFAMAGAFVLRLTGMLFALAGMAGVRSAIPTIIPAVWYALRGKSYRTLVIGPLMGIALWMSTEQGLAILLAFVVISVAALAWDSARRDRARDTFVAVALAVLVLIVAEVAVGGIAGMRGALRYNFSIIPLDQYWYFGAPPNNFFNSWAGVVDGLLHNGWLAFSTLGSIAAVVVCIVLTVRVAAEHRAFMESLGLLAIYGLISLSTLLGVVTQIYSQSAQRVLLIASIAGLTYYARWVDRRDQRRRFLGVSRPVSLTAVALIILSLLGAPVVAGWALSAFTHTLPGHLFGNERFSIAGIWPETFAIDSVVMAKYRRPDGSPPVTWSTYAGWMEARNGTFNPSFDYIIHALGPDNRARYVEQFRAVKPDLVQTVLPTYSQYEAWLEANHWAFYDELLRNYRVAGLTPWSIFWDRRSVPLPAPQLVATLPVDPRGRPVGFQIPAGGNRPILLEIQIDYEVHNPLARLPIVGNTPRYLVLLGGALQTKPVSLAPYDTTKRFPLIANPGSQIGLNFGTYGLLPGASWRPHAVRVYLQPLDDGDTPWLANLGEALTQPGQQ